MIDQQAEPTEGERRRRRVKVPSRRIARRTAVRRWKKALLWTGSLLVLGLTVYAAAILIQGGGAVGSPPSSARAHP